MANDPLALATPPDSPSEDEYQAFLQALSETARGRAFLAEHARRSRAEDSVTLLSSVQRLEGLVRDQLDTPPPEPVGPNPFDEVRDLLETVRDKQDAFDLGALTAQIGMLADMIEGVHRRIDALAIPAPVEPSPEETAPPLEVEEAAAPADELVASEETAFAAPEPEPITVEDAETESVSEAVPEPELAAEPEAAMEAETVAALEQEIAIEPAFDVAPEAEPEPAMADAEAQPAPDVESQAPALALPVEDAATDMPAEPHDETEQAAEASSAIPEVAWGGAGEPVAADEPAPVAPAPGLAITALVETLVVSEAEEPPPEAKVIKAGTIPPPLPFAGEDFSTGKRARVALPSVDPLADIKALSEEERIALFT